MKCSQCGTANPDEASFCLSCGAKFESRSEDQPAPEVPAPTAEVPPAEEPWPPRLPQVVKAMGVTAIVMSLLMIPLNLYGFYASTSVLSGIRGAETVFCVAAVSSASFVVMSFLTLVAGIGLVRATLWGRRLAIVAGTLGFPIVMAAMIAILACNEWAKLKGGADSSYEVFVCTSLLPMFSVALAVSMFTGESRRWAFMLRAGPGVPPPPEPDKNVPISTAAVVSLGLSLVPAFFISHPVAVLVGVIALIRIKRSNGKLRGSGFAVAGIIISILVCVGLVGLIVAAVLVAQSGR